MIAIVNVSPYSYPFGIHKYEVRINQKIITKFEHRREQGLGVCLRLAADAVDKMRGEGVD